MSGIEIFAIVSGCFYLGVILFILSLLSRLVKSNERIAAAMEAVASKVGRDDK